MKSRLRAALRPPDGQSAPATYVMERLAAGVAALLRVVVAVVGGAAALIGLAPPAAGRWVVHAVLISLLWSVVFAVVAIRRGLVAWLIVFDVAGTTALCVLQARVTAQDALPPGSSWVEVLATVTIVVCQFACRPPAATVGGLVVIAGYAVGADRAHLTDHGIVQMAIFTIQLVSSGLLMWSIRRAARSADAALVERGRAQAESEGARARRRAEREHSRQLHDTVLATLTVVGTGALAASTATLRTTALADLDFIEALDLPAVPSARRPAGEEQQVPLHERLAVLAADATDLKVVLHVTGCQVPVPVAAAFTGALGAALANVAAHAGTRRVEVWMRTGNGLVEVVVEDTGTGFDPARVPATRYGIREAIVGRMQAAGGTARVVSTPGRGTTVTLEWRRG